MITEAIALLEAEHPGPSSSPHTASCGACTSSSQRYPEAIEAADGRSSWPPSSAYRSRRVRLASAAALGPSSGRAEGPRGHTPRDRPLRRAAAGPATSAVFYNNLAEALWLFMRARTRSSPPAREGLDLCERRGIADMAARDRGPRASALPRRLRPARKRRCSRRSPLQLGLEAVGWDQPLSRCALRALRLLAERGEDGPNSD